MTVSNETRDQLHRTAKAMEEAQAKIIEARKGDPLAKRYAKRRRKAEAKSNYLLTDLAERIADKVEAEAIALGICKP